MPSFPLQPPRFARKPKPATFAVAVSTLAIAAGSFGIAGTSSAALVGATVKSSTFSLAGASVSSFAGSTLDSGAVAIVGASSSSLTGAAFDAGILGGAGLGSSAFIGARLDAASLAGAGLATTGLTAASLAAGAISGAGLGSASLLGSELGSGQLAAAGLATSALVGATGSITASGTLSAAGLASTSLLGFALDAGAWSASGLGSSAFTGAALDASSWTIAGLATSAIVGSATDATTFAIAGASTSGLAGATLTSSAAIGSALASSALVGAALDSGTWVASGASVSALVGSAIATSVGTLTAAGFGSSALVGAELDAAPWSGLGTGTVAMVGAALDAGVLTAAGTSAVAFSQATTPFTGSGDSSAAFVGQSIVAPAIVIRGGGSNFWPLRWNDRPRLIQSTASAGFEMAGEGVAMFDGASVLEVVSVLKPEPLAFAPIAAPIAAPSPVAVPVPAPAPMPWAPPVQLEIASGGFTMSAQGVSNYTGETLFDEDEIEKRIQARMALRAEAVRADVAPVAPKHVPVRVAATAAVVQAHRSFGLAKRRQRVPKQVYPKLIEMEYAKAMVSMIRHQIRPAFAPLLRELPELLGRSIAEGQRMDVGESKRARDLIDLARRQMGVSLDTSRIEALAHTFADRTQKHNAEQLGKQVRAALGVDLMGPAQQAMGTPISRLVGHFVQENVALIKSIPDVIATDMDKLVTRAFSSGMPHPALAKHIEQTFNVGESRARLIARDQIGKINGQINSVRQQDLGITSFRWTTVGDERVRSEHEDLNGQQFDYSDPPDEGLPGEPIQCRCTAEPVFESIMAALEDP